MSAIPPTPTTPAAAAQDGAPAATQFPEQGWLHVARRPERVLLVCYYDPHGISTVPETVAFMQSHSRYAVTVLNLFEHRVDSGFLRLHPWVQLDGFDAVVIHNTVAYNVDNVRSLDVGLARKLRDFRGAKVLMKQDENYRFRELARYIGEARFDVVFTCLPPEALPLVYPEELAGSPRFERMLTGYVTPTLRGIAPSPGPRPIDIGYRGSIQPLSFGRLAYEKRKIGEDVERLLAGRGLVLDISSRWEDRYGGETWLDFMRSCKATLGAESGASIFDLDGGLEQRIAAVERRHAGLASQRERDEAVLAELADLEGNVDYAQVSPRHFEAAACGTVQLLFPGRYSSVLQPGRHYFPLQRDYSNLDEAVALLRDEAGRASMARRAYEEVVLDPANWIETFVARIDDCIAGTLEAKGAAEPAEAVQPADAHNVLLLVAHDPALDPRLRWIAEGAPRGMRVQQVGVLHPSEHEPRRQAGVMVQPRQAWGLELGRQLLAEAAQSPAGMAAAQELLLLQQAAQLPERDFCALFGAPPQAARNGDFRWYLQYLLDTSATLVAQARRLRGFHAVVAADLDALPAALLLKGLFGVPVLYDAHEYWPEQDVTSYEYEKDFWRGLERRLVQHADLRQTVSPGLAALMAAHYGVPFEAVPNCEPADRLLPPPQRAARADGSCHFVYQGIFAPARGLDLLVDAWAEADRRAVLHLRGPDSPFKERLLERARQAGLLGRRIFFPDPVDAAALIGAAAEGDVGLVPYTPTGTNYRHCCPNKLSQYLAAGLPVLANDTSFVKAVVSQARCGIVTDFARRDRLLHAVAQLCESPGQRAAFGEAGRAYFRSTFNWNIASAGMYRRLADAMAGHAPEPLLAYWPTVRPAPLAPAPSAASAVFAPKLLASLLPTRVPRDPREAAGAAPPPPGPLLSPPPWYRAALGLWRRLPSPVRRALDPLARRLRARLGT